MIAQGTFAALPPLNGHEIGAQLDYALDNGWAISVEVTDDPHPRNTYWDMWGLPMFDLTSARDAFLEVQACRKAFPTHYIKVTAFDCSKGRETIALSFLVQRPVTEPGFRLDRETRPGRTVGYRLHPYAADRRHGARYE